MTDEIQSLQRPEILSPLTLAFMGDAVYELFVRRELICQNGSMPAHVLHEKAVELVRCSAQAKAYCFLSDSGLLDETEAAVLRRGRNNSSVKCPKNADLMEYRRATGVEALFGYLFLAGRQERLEELFHRILQEA
jgi:ribonuclease-3 family protein